MQLYGVKLLAAVCKSNYFVLSIRELFLRTTDSLKFQLRIQYCTVQSLAELASPFFLCCFQAHTASVGS